MALRLNVSVSTGGRGCDLGLETSPSSTSPKRNAAFSRPEPDAGRLLDLRNGEADLGGDDESGSSIHEKLDCAMVDRVGTGALGL